MIGTFTPLIALMTSIFMLMLGNGLINILLPVRMGLDGIETETIGVVLSLYAVGMLLGGIYSRHLIARVGHIRMFAASAAIGAITILICGLMSDAVLWGAMRILIGFSNAVAFTVMDGWLSDQSTRENRGRILAINQSVILLAMFAGQFLINIADPASHQLFMLCGILLCFAVVPVTTGRNHGPRIEEIEHMPIAGLFRLAPLGMTSAFLCGILYSSILTMLPVFSIARGFSDLQLSLIMGAAISGAFLLQFPIGQLSDRYDRRTVLLYILLVAMAAALSVPPAADEGLFWLMLLAVAISGGIIACLYPLSISETFDRLRQSEMITAMGSIITVYAGGSIIGPVSSAVLMEKIGPSGLFFFLAAVQFALILFVLFRMRVRPALPVEEQEAFVMHDATISAIELDPRTAFVAAPEPPGWEVESIAAIAEHDPERALELAGSLVAGAPESDREQAIGFAVALARVDGVDAMRLYSALSAAAPAFQREIAEAIAATVPERAAEIVPLLMEGTPDSPAEAVAAIAQAVPAQGAEVVGAAAEAGLHNSPEDAPILVREIVENLASNLSDARDELRYTDRAFDDTDQQVAGVVHRLAEITPELAADAAVAAVEVMPEAAPAVVESTPQVAAEVARVLDAQDVEKTRSPT